jgi:hypothetical protein
VHPEVTLTGKEYTTVDIMATYSLMCIYQEQICFAQIKNQRILIYVESFLMSNLFDVEYKMSLNILIYSFDPSDSHIPLRRSSIFEFLITAKVTCFIAAILFTYICLALLYIYCNERLDLVGCCNLLTITVGNTI